MTRHILILGGTTEARLLASALDSLARTDWRVTLSLAGRTAAPLPQAVPVRSGGFGGVVGLAAYLRAHEVAALVDATHPYAAIMSVHAVAAAASTGTPLITLRRAPWCAVAGDRWTLCEDVREAVRLLGARPRRVFLAMGRGQVDEFAAAPQHHYVVRSIDAVQTPARLPHARYLQARGPFAEDDERALLLEHAIEVIVAKNSGGQATYGKIAAARALDIPVLLLRRPPDAAEHHATHVAQVVAWLHQVLGTGIERGV